MSPIRYRLQKADDNWWKQNISCLHACPAHTNVPRYISLIAEGKCQEAFDLNRKANVFPAILGRICMHPCETACRRRHIDQSVAICALKRAAADHKPDNDKTPEPAVYRNQHALAVVGAGPAGLAAADDLARMGYRVTVFETLPVAGGMLNVGIPPYRLDRMTNVNGVFAVGDYTTGPRDIISVIADAYRVSAAIHGYLQGALQTEKGRCFQQPEAPHTFDSNFDALPRQNMPILPAVRL